MAGDLAARSDANCKPVEWSIAVMCFNEKESLPEMIRRTVSVLRQQMTTFEVVIIEDGSTDGTREVAAQLARQYPEVRVFQHATNLGIGQVLIDGYAQTCGNYAGCLPADMQFAPENLTQVMEAMQNADVVHVRRLRRQDPGMRRWISAFDETFVSLLFGMKVRDMHWVHFYRRNVLRRVTLTSRTPVIDVELLYQAQKMGAKRVDIELPHHPRTMGRSTSASFGKLIAALADLLALRIRLLREKRTASPRLSKSSLPAN